jgi:hypothetical protein
MYVCGFVPWRLRMLSTGDPVPEVLPLGMFMWTIETIPDSVASSYSSSYGRSNSSNTMELSGKASFKKQQQFFHSNRYTPYRIESDNHRRNDSVKIAGVKMDDKDTSKLEEDEISGSKDDDSSKKEDEKKMKRSTIAFIRQQMALKRQGIPDDDESTKSLR